jgi:hypothetical protein
LGGLDHSVIVQVKKKKGRAKKGDLLLFHSVVLDIPGSVEVFVSEQGYQKGALEVAREQVSPRSKLGKRLANLSR